MDAGVEATRNQLTTPARFTPKDIGVDYVLGIQKSEDGVETIAMYPLRRR